MMRTLPVLLCGAALVVAPGLAPAGSVRDALLDRELRSLDGEVVDLSDLEGSVVVLNFWAEWCAPCQRELPVFDTWNDELAPRGAHFVAVSIDRQSRKAKQLAERLGLDLPLFHDGPDGLARELDLPSLPITYVLAADGSTAHVASGSTSSTLDELRAAIEAQLPAHAATAHEVNGGER